MFTVIGLGSAGCNIAEMFEKLDTYQVKLIDCEIEGDNCFSLPKYNSPEDYENNLPDLKSFLEDCRKKVLFIVGGSGKVSGASLKILSYIKDREIYILYLRPDRETLSFKSSMQDKVTFNVLQEYARSAMFKRIVLVDNTKIESLLGDIPVIGYYNNLNTIIFNTLSGLISLQEINPVISNYTDPSELSRITTYGIYDLESDTEKMFYDFDFVEDKCYSFIINENILKTDGKLFKSIKDKIKQKSINNLKISYKIYSTQQETSYCYIEAHTKKIQS